MHIAANLIYSHATVNSIRSKIEIQFDWNQLIIALDLQNLFRPCREGCYAQSWRAAVPLIVIWLGAVRPALSACQNHTHKLYIKSMLSIHENIPDNGHKLLIHKRATIFSLHIRCAIQVIVIIVPSHQLLELFDAFYALRSVLSPIPKDFPFIPCF